VLICGECSARNNAGESFCGNCGAYLVWQRAPAAAEEQRPTQASGPGPGPGPAVTTVPLPVVPAPPSPGPGPAPGIPPGAPSDTTPGQGPDSGPVNRPTRGAHMAGSAGGDARENTGVQHPAAPVVLGRAGPAEVKPGQRVVPAPSPAPLHDEPAPLPGEVICGRCGAGNKPARNFCRRCAASLKEAAAVPVAPWWRRFLRRPQRSALPAGTRPKRGKQRRFPTRSVSFLTVMGLFGGVAYLGRDVIAAAVARVQDELLEDREVFAQGMTATSRAPDRGPELAIDSYSNRSWAAGAPGHVSADLEAAFASPFRLTYVVISGGASDEQDVFFKERRPASVEIIASRTDGGQQTSRTVKLQDVPGPQSFYVGADQVSAVTLKILSSNGPEEAPVSVAEVQFAGR
jgi:ribosomal protein L40E